MFSPWFKSAFFSGIIMFIALAVIFPAYWDESWVIDLMDIKTGHLVEGPSRIHFYSWVYIYLGAWIAACLILFLYSRKKKQ